jgi:hypothetical protein
VASAGGYRSKFDQMTGEPVNKLVGRLAVPAILIMMVPALYNMADTYSSNSDFKITTDGHGQTRMN